MPTTARKNVTIYTDGACSGNPGPGGWAAILRYGAHEREMSGGFRKTTNNRMELMGAIKALEALRERCSATLISDSEYVVNGIKKGWAEKWRAAGWKRPKGTFAPNWELWQRLLDLCEKHHVRFEWVEGHAGHAENERCDELAVAEYSKPNLPPDEGYEQPPIPHGT
ncbi:MAG: ribonuclease HI [Bacteroidales bacterium]